MNVWGLFVALFGLLLVVIAVRNSVGNLAPLVPGQGGSADPTAAPATLAAVGPGETTTSATAGPGAAGVNPGLSGLYTAPRASQWGQA